MPDSPEGLLRACEAARRDGKDFPTIWNTILKRHPLVIDLPTHRVTDGEAQIVVSLITGQAIVSSRSGYSIA